MIIRLTEKSFNLIGLLLKNKAIFEMCIEDLEIWKGFNKIYPSYVRFPECYDWNYPRMYVNRVKEKRKFEKTIKRINIEIRGQLGIIRLSPSKSSIFLKERKEMLEKHLKSLKKIRDKRYKLEVSK